MAEQPRSKAEKHGPEWRRVSARLPISRTAYSCNSAVDPAERAKAPERLRARARPLNARDALCLGRRPAVLGLTAGAAGVICC